MDINAFNFDAMKEAVGIDPFAKTTNKYAEDNRFYKLTKDKDGNGAALIRFLPDSERGMIQKLFKLNTTITKNGKKRFVSEYSPSSIGLPCPFQEEWQKLWNNGDKEIHHHQLDYHAHFKRNGKNYGIMEIKKTQKCSEEVLNILPTLKLSKIQKHQKMKVKYFYLKCLVQ